MRRGEIYRVKKPTAKDPKRYRSFIVVSRQTVIASRFSTVICAPIYSVYDSLSSQVPIGIVEGMKHECSIHCDELISLPKSMLSGYVGMLSDGKIQLLDRALLIALQLAL